MSKKDGPTVLIDSGFVFNSETLDFVNENRCWALKLFERFGKISLKFVAEPYQKYAEFMWDGIRFTEIHYSSRVFESCAVLRRVKGLAHDNFGAGEGTLVPFNELWNKEFQPSLRAAVKKCFRQAHLAD